MRTLIEMEVNEIGGGGDMGPDNMPPVPPPGQNVAEFVREWNALHPHNHLPVSG